MPRLARTVLGGVPHHVTQRGNRRERVFFTDADYHFYRALLQHYSTLNRLEVLAYCLMPNHVHLVAVPSVAEALHRTFKPVHTRTAQRVNLRYGWRGHVWQGRFFSCALDERHLWAAIRYVECNPVRAGIVSRASRYRWSSAAAHCGLRDDPVLTRDRLWLARLAQLEDWPAWLSAGADDEFAAVRSATQRGLPLGSEKFLAGAERRTGRTLVGRAPGRPRLHESRVCAAP